jgi:hypothetical protein
VSVELIIETFVNYREVPPNANATIRTHFVALAGFLAVAPIKTKIEKVLSPVAIGGSDINGSFRWVGHSGGIDGIDWKCTVASTCVGRGTSGLSQTPRVSAHAWRERRNSTVLLLSIRRSRDFLIFPTNLQNPLNREKTIARVFENRV